MSRTLVLATAVPAAAAAAVAFSVQPSRAAPAAVNVGAMETSIKRDLRARAVGYAYVISQNGNLARQGASGFARTKADGDIAMKTSTRVPAMSVTKNITAVATLRLLKANRLSIDSPVRPWLPKNADWTIGFGFWGPGTGITFRHLLTHRSGLGQMFDRLSESDRTRWSNDWNGLEFIVANGAQPGAPYKYKNANYALLRLMIPALWRAANPRVPKVTKSNVSSLYLKYVNQFLFAPIGIKSVGCSAGDSKKAALVYDARRASAGGRLISSDDEGSSGCGGHSGLRLSAIELARFHAFLRHTSKVIPAGVRQAMDAGKLGWDDSSSGGRYWHGGDGFWVAGDVRREVHTCVAKFPENVEATIVVNSSIRSPKSACRILLDAFARGSS